MSVDWDEFERRGRERREKRRNYPPATDGLALFIGAVLCFLIILWVVWGLAA